METSATSRNESYGQRYSQPKATTNTAIRPTMVTATNNISLDVHLIASCPAAYSGALGRIVSKRKGSRYSAGRSPDWLKSKNPESPAVRREAEEDWGR